jgi:hypothetical protein
MDDCIHGLWPSTCSICLAGPPRGKRKRGGYPPGKKPKADAIPRWSRLPGADRPNVRVFESGMYAPSRDDRRFNTPGRLEGENRAPRPFPKTRPGQRTEGRVSSTFPRNTY